MKRFIAGFGSAILAAFATGLPIAAAAMPFTHRFALELDGRAPYYALALPPAVYAASRRSDLGDLRVFNGAGEPVPYSLDAPPARSAPVLHPVNWFPLPAAASEPATAAGVLVAPDGTLRFTTAAPKASWRDADLLDIGPATRHAGALVVHLRDERYQGRVHVDASTDLQSWRAVAVAVLGAMAWRLLRPHDTTQS